MDHPTIIRKLGGVKAVSDELGLPYITVVGWQQRGRIPVRHWPAIIALAGASGVPWVTCDLLMAGYALRRVAA